MSAQSATLPQAESATLPQVSKAEKKKTRSVNLANALIPSVVSAIVGFFIWNVQNDIQRTVTDSNQVLQTQLALKEEFYKRRLTIYEEACKNIASVKQALDKAESTPQNKTQAMKKIEELYMLNAGNTLYWSDDVEKRLGALWALSIDKLRGEKDADENIRIEISGLHRQMKDDLNVKEKSTISH
jgi:hypothetical protein